MMLSLIPVIGPFLAVISLAVVSLIGTFIGIPKGISPLWIVLWTAIAF